SSVHIPCRSGSPQGVLNAAVEDTGASAAPPVIDAAKPTLNATMARADTVLKLKRQSRMKVSFRLQWDGTVPSSSNDTHDSASRYGPIWGTKPSVSRW